MEHKFSIGQMVDLDRDHLSRKDPKGPYRIVRYSPQEDAHDEPSYRIQNMVDRHERVVKESTLVALPPTSS